MACISHACVYQARRLAAVLGAMALASAAGASPPPDHGLDWVTIGSPGNRLPNADEAPHSYNGVGWPAAGSVGYEYRLTRTEITTAQWSEFVRAYAPYYTGPLNSSQFLSVFVDVDIGPPGTAPTFSYSPGAADYAAAMGWRWAARYCNWLHNDKRSEQWAFESGVYDTSTFTRNADGSLNDQLERSPGARFWIPNRDEWVKGVFYDPHRYGPGQDGYWTYSNMSNDPLIPGFPQDGGQTNADVGPNFRLPVGSYPHVTTPWGLLDASGIEAEWGEGATRSSPASSLAATSAMSRPRAPCRSPFVPGTAIGLPAAAALLPVFGWVGLLKRRRTGFLLPRG